MRSDRMFKTALWGVEEGEVLEYMDRLLAVIEHQKERYEKNHEFLIRQMREDLARESRLHKRKRRRRYLVAGLCPLVCLIFLGLFWCLWMGSAKVTGNSMNPFLREGDFVIYGRGRKEYRRGELVVSDVDGIRIIKRVAGLPGDIIRQDEDGKVRVISSLEGRKDGTEALAVAAQGDGARQIFLNKDEYFLLGDNRDLSIDSRDERIGPVLADRIEGSVLMVIRRIPAGNP